MIKCTWWVQGDSVIQLYLDLTWTEIQWQAANTRNVKPRGNLYRMCEAQCLLIQKSEVPSENSALKMSFFIEWNQYAHSTKRPEWHYLLVWSSPAVTLSQVTLHTVTHIILSHLISIQVHFDTPHTKSLPFPSFSTGTRVEIWRQKTYYTRMFHFSSFFFELPWALLTGLCYLPHPWETFSQCLGPQLLSTPSRQPIRRKGIILVLDLTCHHCRYFLIIVKALADSFRLSPCASRYGISSGVKAVD